MQKAHAPSKLSLPTPHRGHSKSSGTSLHGVPGEMPPSGYPVITAAVQGDPDAVNRVIGHYSGYIAALSTRTSYDPQGCPHSQVDDDLRRRLETKLIIAILDFDLT